MEWLFNSVLWRYISHLHLGEVIFLYFTVPRDFQKIQVGFGLGVFRRVSCFPLSCCVFPCLFLFALLHLPPICISACRYLFPLSRYLIQFCCCISFFCNSQCKPKNTHYSWWFIDCCHLTIYVWFSFCIEVIFELPLIDFFCPSNEAIVLLIFKLLWSPPKKGDIWD